MNRQQRSDFYKPTGPKVQQLGIPWVNGGAARCGPLDLSLPIAGVRLTFRGRLVVGGAGYASATPEGFLNLIPGVRIDGVNARQKGNVTLYQTDLATQWVSSHMFASWTGLFTISAAGAGADAAVPDLGTPFPAPATAVPNRAPGLSNVTVAGTYDFRISCDFVFHPLSIQGQGKHQDNVPAFLVRNEEWKDSVNVNLQFGTVTDGAVAGALGTGVAATTNTFSQYGAGGGTPLIDVYLLPLQMGPDLKDKVVPGVYSRTNQFINVALLTAAGVNVTLLNLQKQPTPRIIVKTGTFVAAAPAFAALSDQVITAIGTIVGGNRDVKSVVDFFAHKADIAAHYERVPIEGYTVQDFIQSGNVRSGYPGENLGDGSTFALVGTTPGTVGGQCLVIQEMMTQSPEGQLYQ